MKPWAFSLVLAALIVAVPVLAADAPYAGDVRRQQLRHHEQQRRQAMRTIALPLAIAVMGGGVAFTDRNVAVARGTNSTCATSNSSG